jgi:hypothetical protein
MLAMDVVDTLRHADRLVERELGSDERDRQLKERLREIYRSQGIEVTETILDEGVAALKEERFQYKPAGPGLGRSLALLWIDRGRYGKWLLVGLTCFTLFHAVRWLAFELPAERKQEALRQERVDLPKFMTNELTQIKAVAKEPEAVATAERLVSEGMAAMKGNDLVGARAKRAELKGLLENLQQSYVLRIVTGPNQKSGVYRIPQANPRARNYYVIVQAISPEGKVLSVPVYSEEDNKIERVSRWGIRVDESVYNRIRADKLDDGIIQNNRFGEKREGYLNPVYNFPVQGGNILEW